MNPKTLFILIITFLSSIHAIAQLTSDSTFSQDGYFISPLAEGKKYGPVMKELPNGTILVAGCATDSVEFRLWKYDAVGNPVTSFGTNGTASIPSLDSVKGFVYYIRDIDTQSDGKILVLAEHTRMLPGQLDSDKMHIVVMRFNTNGSIDNSFNGKGYLMDRPVMGYEYKPKAMVIEKSDGKNNIIVGSWVVETGHTQCPLGYGKWSLSKYLTNGSKDLNFNGIGYIQEPASVIKQASTQSPVATIYDMKIVNDKVVIAGALHNFDMAYFTMRINTDGQWDNTFGTNGRCIHPVTFSVPTNDLTNAQVLADGSSVFYSILRYFGGGAGGVDSSELNGVKNTSNGTPDANFGIGGVLNFSYLSGQYPIFIFKSDNSSIFSYYRKYGAQFQDQKIEFMHFFANGTKDLSFGTNGLLKTNPRSPDDYVNGSQVLHGVWTNNETGIYLTCYNQPYNSPGGRNGIFKYKWDGLTPLQVPNFNKNDLILTYPNPIPRGHSFFVLHSQVVKPTFSLYNLAGQKISIAAISDGIGKTKIDIKGSILKGIYNLIMQENGKYTSRKVLVE